MLESIIVVAVPLDLEVKLPNRTYKTGDGTGLVVAIDVFHQLHCVVCCTRKSEIFSHHLCRTNFARLSIQVISPLQPISTSHFHRSLSPRRSYGISGNSSDAYYSLLQLNPPVIAMLI